MKKNDTEFARRAREIARVEGCSLSEAQDRLMATADGKRLWLAMQRSPYVNVDTPFGAEQWAPNPDVPPSKPLEDADDGDEVPEGNVKCADCLGEGEISGERCEKCDGKGYYPAPPEPKPEPKKATVRPKPKAKVDVQTLPERALAAMVASGRMTQKAYAAEIRRRLRESHLAASRAT